ncbi:MAG: hypothetical protein HKO92_05055 [Flavobacteriaceae bacterium]|nr:hypothetical protein [Flavobacteriaceae bacterium]
MNSNFLSIYYSFALYAVLKFDTLFKHKAIIVSILVIGIIQIFSVIGLISMIIILILKVLPKSLPKIAVVLFSTFLVLISLISLGNELREKPNYLKKLEKIESRAIIWPIAIETIRENPLFGLGIKNAQKMLESKYPKKGDFGFISQMTKKDAHNMYIQIILEIGIIGFLLFLFNIVFFIKKTKKYKYALVCKVFIFLCLTIFFTESALATYAFLSFFSFFYCLLFSISINNVNMQDY